MIIANQTVQQIAVSIKPKRSQLAIYQDRAVVTATTKELATANQKLQLIEATTKMKNKTETDKHPCLREPTREELDGAQPTFHPWREEVRVNTELEKWEKIKKRCHMNWQKEQPSNGLRPADGGKTITKPKTNQLVIYQDRAIIIENQEVTTKTKTKEYVIANQKVPIIQETTKPKTKQEKPVKIEKRRYLRRHVMLSHNINDKTVGGNIKIG